MQTLTHTAFFSIFTLVTASVAYAQVYTGLLPQHDQETYLPKCTLSADPVLIYNPYTTTLSWTTQNATNVSITDAGSVALSGQTIVSNIYSDRTFVLSATNGYGTRTCKVQVFSKETPTGVQSTTYANVLYPPYYYNNPIYKNQALQQGYATQNTGYYAQNGVVYTYPQNQTNVIQTSYQTTQPVTYGTAHDSSPAPTYQQQSHRIVSLSRVPYTGPVENVLAAVFSLTVLVSSLYSVRRLV
jgi:hypothetical protein